VDGHAYNLSFAVLLITIAALGDLFGRRRLFSVGLGLFAAASAACALAPDVGWLIAARAVQGVGAALVAPLGLALLGAAFPPDRRGCDRARRGSALARRRPVRWPPRSPVRSPRMPITRMEESFGPDKTLDAPGLVLVTAAAVGLVWGLVRGNGAGWDSIEVLGALIAGVALTAAFVSWQMRAREPMLPMRLFRTRSFSAGNAAIFFCLASLFGAVFLMAQYMQAALGYGPLETGLRMLPWTGLVMFVAPITGALTARVGERAFMTGGLLLQTAGMAGSDSSPSRTLATPSSWLH
jgi:MFS family permease